MLKELVEKGYGKKNNIIKPNNIKSIKSMTKCDEIYKLTFTSSEDKDEE